MKKLLIALLTMMMATCVTIGAAGCDFLPGAGGGSSVTSTTSSKDSSKDSSVAVTKYTVTFDTDGGSTIAPQTIVKGQTAQKPADPTKTGYTFAGWKNGTADFAFTTPINGNVTLKASWTVNKYLVKFVNEDGTVLQEGQVEYGTTPEYTGATPTKTATAQYSYTFKGWDKTIATVTGEATYTATYDATVNKYLVKFVNEDGTVLQEGQVEYGATPEYTGAAPTKAPTAQYGYEFAGWDKTIAAVTGEATYTATYTPITAKYLVKFVNEDGTVLQEGQVEYGAMPTYTGETPTKAPTAQYTYTFKNWNTTIVEVTGEATYTATYDATVNKYLVKFVNEDGTVLQEGQVEYGATPAYTGETPTKAPTAQYTYTFKDWNTAIVEVTGEATYTATYDATVNKYLVKFVNEDGTVLQEGQVEYGTLPAYTGETPTKAPTAQYGYTFDGWTTTIVEVTGEATYTAKFTETVNEYTVTFVDEDGTVLGTATIAYGEKVTAPSVEAREDFEFEGWTKDGADWDMENGTVEGEMTLVAKWKDITNDKGDVWDDQKDTTY